MTPENRNRIHPLPHSLRNELALQEQAIARQIERMSSIIVTGSRSLEDLESQIPPDKAAITAQSEKIQSANDQIDVLNSTLSAIKARQAEIVILQS